MGHLPEPLKSFLDGLAASVTVAAFLSWLPHIAAALGVVWAAYRIYEVRLNIKLLKKQLKE